MRFQLLLCLFLGAACHESAPVPGGDVPYLGLDAVVLPASCADQARWLGYSDGEAAWTPQLEYIGRVNALIRPLLEKALQDPTLLQLGAEQHPDRSAWLQREVGLILGDFDDYRRQYLGLINQAGRIQILVRFFPGPAMDPAFEFERWRKEIVVVSDGGADYWYVVFDVDRDELVRFESNGYA